MKNKSSLPVIIAAFFANLFIAAIKFVVAWFTRSSAMLAEAIHSTADMLNQILLIIGVKRSEKKADDLHPFGFSLETYFWSFIVALFLFTAGALFSVYEGIHKLLHPAPLKNVHYAIGVLFLSLIAEFFSFRVAAKKMKQERGHERIFPFLKKCKKAELIVVYMEDLAAMIGLSLAMTFLIIEALTGILIFDALASVAIGILLAVIALFLGFETKSLLIGESADPVLLHTVFELIKREESINRIIHIRSLQFGPEDILLAIKAEFNQNLNTVQISSLINSLETEIRSSYPTIKKIYIEPDIYLNRWEIG